MRERPTLRAQDEAAIVEVEDDADGEELPDAATVFDGTVAECIEWLRLQPVTEHPFLILWVDAETWTAAEALALAAADEIEGL